MLTHRSQLQQLEGGEERREEEWRGTVAGARLKPSPGQTVLYKWNIPHGFTMIRHSTHLRMACTSGMSLMDSLLILISPWTVLVVSIIFI